MGFKSIWDIEYQLLKKQFFIFWKRDLCRVLDCVHSFWRFLYKSWKNVGQCHQNQLPFLVKWLWGQPKAFALSCAWLVYLVLNEKRAVRSSRDYCSWINTSFCSTAVLGFACASFRRLRMVLWLFTSCVWDVLRYRILRKTTFDFLGNVVFVVLYCVQLFWWFSYKPSENIWAISPKGKHKISRTTLSTFQNCLFELCSAFFVGCKWKNCFENFLRSLYLGKIRVFHSNTESRFGCASSRRLRLVLWRFPSCVWDVLWYRILIKTAFVYWAK